MARVRLALFTAVVFSLSAAPAVRAQTSQASQPPSASGDSSGSIQSQPETDIDPLNRPQSDKQKFKQQKELGEELKGQYKTWVEQDVRWIITDQELKAFKSLSNDEERDAFIENFWRRRNPDPDSPENTFKEEYYERIAYANEHFAAGEPGWKTDMGMIYIKYGPPDSKDDHSSGGEYERPMSEGGGVTSAFPFQIWHYRYIEGIGNNIDIEFVDTCMCGAYHMTLDRGEKDALLHVPGAGLTYFEQQGQANKGDRMQHGLEQLGDGPSMRSEDQSKEFDRLEQFAQLTAPPEVKYTDLEGFLVNHKVLTGPFFPFDVRTDFVKVTDDVVMVPITLQIKNKDITFVTKDGVAKGDVEVLGRISTITDKVVDTFEDPLSIEQPSELLPQELKASSVHQWILPLQPGRYRIDIAIKDVNNPDHVGTYAQSIIVPKYEDDKLSASSLILADKMEAVPTKEIGTGQFILGNTFVRPRVSSSPTDPVSFHQSQKLGFWMQVYNLSMDDKSKQNSATVHYQITDLASNKTILDTTETGKALGDTNSDQITVEKSLPLTTLQPGKYEVKITVDDGISKQQVAQKADFVVD